MSRWWDRNSPDDVGFKTNSGYPYMVDSFQTTIVPSAKMLSP